jgi:hypothetical protein
VKPRTFKTYGVAWLDANGRGRAFHVSILHDDGARLQTDWQRRTGS